MKTVYLLRHAKGESKHEGKQDFKRNISQRGENDAFKVAERLTATESTPSVIISSPALRARQTASIFAQHLGYMVKHIRTRKVLYDQDLSAYMEILGSLDPGYESVMLVGHNPSLSEFARQLLDGFDSDLPTCGLLCLEFDVSSWDEVEQDKAEIRIYDYPKRGNGVSNIKDKKAFRKDLENKLIRQIEQVLSAESGRLARKVRRPIRKSSRKLARKFVEKIK